MNSTIAFYQEQFRPNSHEQKKCFETFQKLGLPHRRVERWKFTPIAKWFEKKLPLAKNTPNLKEKSQKNLQFTNGVLTSHNSNIKVSTTPFSKAYQKIQSSFPVELEDSMLQFFLGTVDNIYTIQLTQGLHTIDHNFTTSELSRSLIIYELEENSHIQETFHSETDSLEHFSFILNFFDIKRNAHVQHTGHNLCAGQGALHYSLLANIQGSAQLSTSQMTYGPKLSRVNTYINLQDKKGHAQANALSILKGQQHCDYHSKITHLKGENTSSQLVKNILSEEAKSIFTGRIHIAPQAQLVESEQLNRNLIIGNKAHAHGQPQMEIFADDVKCAHGSTTGQMSDDEVFYFLARGIPLPKAKEMLGQAFAKEVVSKIQSPKLREHAYQNLNSYTKEVRHAL